ncbi:MAG: hypothetical protein KJO35_11035, partial [Gammaproteobacteria bacterium]|nr:hypothetical protein [Gammaproteobacteria bacterium]
MSDSKQPDRACLRFGWTALAIFATLGLTLEGLHLIKSPFYLQMHMRQDLWTLAHAHGTILALVNILFGLFVARWIMDASARSRSSLALRAAGILMPAGFFLGGIG